MQLRESEVQTLTDLGLTATQAKVYLCLAILGNSTAKSLTECSKVSRQDIYRVLGELFELGLVEKELGKPTGYRAISVDACLVLLSERLEKKTRMIHDAAAKVLSEFGRHTPVKVGGYLSDLLLVSGQEAVLIKAQELLGSVSESLAVISPPQNVFPWILGHSSLFRQALKRNVKIRLITEKPTNEKSMQQVLGVFNGDSGFDLRVANGGLSVSFGVYDCKKLILELSADEGYVKSHALISENACLAELAQNYFETTWNNSCGI
jgi:sugar-specific transcriptional regulator TrmB